MIPGETIVSLDAAWLGIEPVVLVVLLGELFLDGPGLSPHGRIFNGDDVFERGWPGPRPALNQVQILARALKIGLRTEVRHIIIEPENLSRMMVSFYLALRYRNGIPHQSKTGVDGSVFRH